MYNRLKELSPDSPDQFYKAWPDVRQTADRWKPLLGPLCAALVGQPSFYSHTRGDWIALTHSVLQRFDVAVPEEVATAVVKVYTVTQQNLVQLPEHVHITLQHFGLLNEVAVINPSRVSQLIADCLPHLTDTDRLHLLRYFSLNGTALDALLNQQLLPLADGTYGAFKGRPGVPVFWCHHDLAQLFPGLESQFCDSKVPADVNEYLRCLAESGK